MSSGQLSRCARDMLLMVSAGSVLALEYRSHPTSIRNISARLVNSLKALRGAISNDSKKKHGACTAPRTRSRIRAKEQYTISIDRSNLHFSMLVKLTRTLNVYRANLASRPDAVEPHVRLGPNTDGIIAFGAKSHWNHWMQLEQANWQLGEVLVRESWSTLLEICQSQLGEAWTFIEPLVVLVSSGRPASIPMVGEPCVSLRLIHPLCCQS